MKINLGCGNKKLDGFINVDIESKCNPDKIVDLEDFPWPFDDNSAEELNIDHVLEHIGGSVETHKKIMQELYRICKPNALIRILVPHPRADNFLADPTHVRPILASLFDLYSQEVCQQNIARGDATTPLAIYWNIDFKIKSITYHLYPHWLKKYQNNEISKQELEYALHTYNNVAEEIEIELIAVK